MAGGFLGGVPKVSVSCDSSSATAASLSCFAFAHVLGAALAFLRCCAFAFTFLEGTPAVLLFLFVLPFFALLLLLLAAAAM